MRALPLLPGGTSGEASGTNHDGSLVVGWSDASNGQMTAALWVNDVVQPLVAPDGWRSWATHVSDDGSVILGNLSTSSASVPSVWTPSSSAWTPLADYLASQGFPLPEGWIFSAVSEFDMSANGRTFTGNAVVPAQGGDPATLQAVVITIPSSGTLVSIVIGSMVLSRRRRR